MIREAVASDFNRVMGLMAQLQPSDPIVDDGSDRIVFDEILSSRYLYLFVLESDNSELNATCYLNLIPNLTRRVSPYAVMENVVTEESLRNTGLGKQIIQHAIQFAWDKGCYKVMLQTGSKREEVHEFYKACGMDAGIKTAYTARNL